MGLLRTPQGHLLRTEDLGGAALLGRQRPRVLARLLLRRLQLMAADGSEAFVGGGGCGGGR